LINLFFPYYLCGNENRQQEIDLCLKQNINNKAISKIIVLIDDNSVLPFDDDKITTIHLQSRPTYKKWIQLSHELSLVGVSVLCNSDIYFDQSISLLSDLADTAQKFVALSRWEVIKGHTHLHPNPRWSQDVWAMNCDNQLSVEMLHQLDFPMGVPRCDNKIAYLFGIFGWQVFNPCAKVKSFHVHETELRTYQKKLDYRIIGGVAYVQPGIEYNHPATLELDVWVRSSKNIKSIKINKSLEKWLAEADEENEEKKANQLTKPTTKEQVFEFSPCTTQDLVQAIKQGKSLQRQGSNFELFQLKNDYIFKNGFALKSSIKTPLIRAQELDLEKLFAFGLIPPVLNTFVSEIGLKAKNSEDLNFWQYPCATEKQAYENHLMIKHGDHIDVKAGVINLYVPLPWATYIDRKGFPQSYLQKMAAIIRQYKTITNEAKLQLRVHSVCQHIHWGRVLEKATELGVTDLHFSHKDSKSSSQQADLGFNLTLHGWPLIAVNYVTPDRSKGMERKPIGEKKLLASFIGAHMPHYLDDSRIKLFEAAKASNRDDVFVDLGNEWHFNKVVYEEQVLSKEIESHHIDEHHQKTFRYNTILSDSVFSLCPLGAGPNTLRLWESIAVGTIPVLFSKDLSILTESDLGKEIIDNVVVWDGDIGEHFFEFLENFKHEDLAEKSVNLVSTYQQIETKLCFKSNAKSLNYTVEKTEKKIVKSELKKLNILYVGASVTAQKNGYRPALNRLFENKGYTVRETVLATGATGSMFGLCNLSILEKDRSFDVSFYEYSTGDLNVGLTPSDELEYMVKSSLEYLKCITQKVYVIHNYRSDFEGETGDHIREVYNKVAEDLSINVIDNCSLFEELRACSDEMIWKGYYRDNVHTENNGSEIAAKNIINEVSLESLNNKIEPQKRLCKPMDEMFVYLSNKEKQNFSYVYPSSGQSFPYLILKHGEKLVFQCKGIFWGILSIVGPQSGWVEVKAGDKTIQKYCQFDTHCFYERIQPRQFVRNFEDFTELTIQLVDDEIDFSNVKKYHIGQSKERLLKVSYLMGKELQFKGVTISE
jgi:hypothetical protein